MYSIVYWPEMSIMCKINPLKPHFFFKHVCQKCDTDVDVSNLSTSALEDMESFMISCTNILRSSRPMYVDNDSWTLLHYFISILTSILSFITHFCTYMPYNHGRGNKLLNFENLFGPTTYRKAVKFQISAFKYFQLHVVTSYTVMCALRTRRVP